MTSPLWDEYLAEMSTYLLAVGESIQRGYKFPPTPPARPSEPIPDELRLEAARLQDECDRVAMHLLARMKAIADRPPSARHHHESPAASFIETDI